MKQCSSLLCLLLLSYTAIFSTPNAEETARRFVQACNPAMGQVHCSVSNRQPIAYLQVTVPRTLDALKFIGQALKQECLKDVVLQRAQRASTDKTASKGPDFNTLYNNRAIYQATTNSVTIYIPLRPQHAATSPELFKVGEELTEYVYEHRRQEARLAFMHARYNVAKGYLPARLHPVMDQRIQDIKKDVRFTLMRHPLNSDVHPSKSYEAPIQDEMFPTTNNASLQDAFQARVTTAYSTRIARLRNWCKRQSEQA